MMEMQHRKPNRLPNYDYSQNGAYFVTICTQDRQRTLSEIVVDGFPVPKPLGMLAEQILKELPVKYPAVYVGQYVIMPDHIHILLRIDPDSEHSLPTLGNMIGWYKYQITKRANAMFHTPGKRLLQRSYYDHVVRCQQDYDEIWTYIENNPRKWAMNHGYK